MVFPKVWEIARSSDLRDFSRYLADLNYDVIWMISIPPLISYSSSLSSKLFGTVPRAPITISIIVTLMFHSFFFFSGKDLYLSIFLLFYFHSVVLCNGKIYLTISCLLFVKCHLVYSSRRDWVVRLYLKIPENFMYLILSGGLWFVHISFGMVKFQSLAQFRVGHMSYSIVPCIVLLLR